ncbi:MAG: hypothetical protein CO096_10740 [Armatimonadetes bacterium CG_4_9_14_3_um_filter_66_14]|nr:MAG: hypothetical protein COS65_29180 [Armatimonadetes bacterium CG06_land_8_20_14_3_00_66_21]PIX40931.1 MAG: hypothetical protein COZ57_24765 [Armatimonadetes bacterium CG_4_8_14_3_um_filter_66_20]PJB70784.1 MAG: hypothetical protein CO096_10740 [Armatimonadetes bacterium CG_4_9_14_3_um_filter_66_14]
MDPTLTLRTTLATLLLAAVHCWGQTAPVGLPDFALKEIRTADVLPGGQYTLARAWQAEGPEVGHNGGRAVDDAEAEEGRAWEVEVGEDEPGAVVFGPYAEVEPGDYVALFRMRPAGENGEDSLAVVDACVSYGQDVLAQRELDPAESTPKQYARVPLAFHYAGGKLECRVDWHGYASLRIDSIALYRVVGADLSTTGRVPHPVPSGEPKDLAYYTETRPFPDIFPRSASPARELLVCAVRKEPPDRRLMLLCLQGLVNRTRPEVYCLLGPNDEQWLDWIRQRKWIDQATPTTPDALLARYRDRVKGVVVYDSRLPASKNVATMIASVKDGLAVSARVAGKLGLPVLDDLHDRWQTSVDAYRWAFDNLWPQLNHHVIACSWPEHLGLRDYLVQQVGDERDAPRDPQPVRREDPVPRRALPRLWQARADVRGSDLPNRAQCACLPRRHHVARRRHPRRAGCAVGQRHSGAHAHQAPGVPACISAELVLGPADARRGHGPPRAGVRSRASRPSGGIVPASVGTGPSPRSVPLAGCRHRGAGDRDPRSRAQRVGRRAAGGDPPDRRAGSGPARPRHGQARAGTGSRRDAARTAHRRPDRVGAAGRLRHAAGQYRPPPRGSRRAGGAATAFRSPVAGQVPRGGGAEPSVRRSRSRPDRQRRHRLGRAQREDRARAPAVWPVCAAGGGQAPGAVPAEAAR